MPPERTAELESRLPILYTWTSRPFLLPIYQHDIGLYIKQFLSNHMERDILSLRGRERELDNATNCIDRAMVDFIRDSGLGYPPIGFLLLKLKQATDHNSEQFIVFGQRLGTTNNYYVLQRNLLVERANNLLLVAGITPIPSRSGSESMN